jgi:hypothetical protein
MANWKLIGGIVGSVLILGAISNAVDGNDSAGVPGAAASSQPDATSDGSEQSAVVEDRKPVEKATVPDFAGMGLQFAQDKAQDTGFHSLTSHDALGRERVQAFDRNWKVCTQTPRSGMTMPTDTELDFGAVKLGEDCPAKGQAAPEKAGGTMPAFAGKSVKAAKGALDPSSSITVKDASGGGRFVLIESNWQVCSQDPKPGTKLFGQPVKFMAVKFDEKCP